MLSPGVVVSHYKIIEKIGSGGSGVVYNAEETKLDRTETIAEHGRRSVQEGLGGRKDLKEVPNG
jgi:hypothetical protein